MTLSEFFWLSDAKFAAGLANASDNDLRLQDKHNVRKRKGGALGACVATAQAPMTMGISLFGTGIGIRNRHVAKRRLEMIHAELLRRGLTFHEEDWKDNMFAVTAVAAGTAVGMGFAPGAEAAAQGLAEVGASSASVVAASVAGSQTASAIGSQATEVLSAHYTDPDTYFNQPKQLLEAGMGCYGYGQQQQLCYGYPRGSPYSSPAPSYYSRTPSPSPQPGQQYGRYSMPIPPAPYYG